MTAAFLINEKQENSKHCKKGREASVQVQNRLKNPQKEQRSLLDCLYKVMLSQKHLGKLNMQR